ncbi:uncharacterized protein LOC117122921 [Anneissia japonica]|uniref:uncharacterized protein LOC117122921 n=1 Tax=Anneissia japonica TaxID=1529436 RepID=UPI0014256A82|nr:uncharacterized protein LOC117122921 [Anneissia japonica]XP_033124588.1 uncharacterized protein LOC117122921 [Anneissia japonica]XP_033124589.1 uncharacterized protein LOC117122921 [Anneissia japonica]XP_033124590.1 uncharacterized protein LOC117122921 [Anneissia japonica]XP_033124591.1 uncharacterized protein LOC117122921 [Anneissia japonica]
MATNDGDILRKLLAEVANEYYGERLKSLHFLLSDILTRSTYDAALPIFDELISLGRVTSTNLTLLFDIIHITGLIFLQNTVQKYYTTSPDLKTWRPTGAFSSYRVMLYKVSLCLTDRDISSIHFCYSVKQNVNDIWSAFLYLEKECKLENNDASLMKLKGYINPRAGKLIDNYCARPIQERQNPVARPIQEGQNPGQIITQPSGGEGPRPIQERQGQEPRRLVHAGTDARATGDKRRIDVPDCTIKPDLNSIELLEVAKELGSDWETLAIYLKFTKARVSYFKSDSHGNIQNAIFSMLDAWHKMVSGEEKSRRAQLCEALKKTERMDLVEQVANGTLGHH